MSKNIVVQIMFLSKCSTTGHQKNHSRQYRLFGNSITFFSILIKSKYILDYLLKVFKNNIFKLLENNFKNVFTVHRFTEFFSLLEVEYFIVLIIRIAIILNKSKGQYETFLLFRRRSTRDLMIPKHDSNQLYSDHRNVEIMGTARYFQFVHLYMKFSFQKNSFSSCSRIISFDPIYFKRTSWRWEKRRNQVVGPN